MDQNKIIRSQFSKSAENYVNSKIHSSREDLLFVSKFINPKNNWKTLDVATGTGHLAIELSSLVNIVYAIDITPEMIEKAKIEIQKMSISNIITMIEDVHKLSFPDNNFDLTTSRIAPHHFYDVDTAISEMIRVTKRGGLIFIEDTISPENIEASNYLNLIEKLRDPSHIRDLSVSQWINLFINKNTELMKMDRRIKEWPINWWMNRMNTVDENREKILELLDIYDQYNTHLNFIHKDQWFLYPENGYFLFRKL